MTTVGDLEIYKLPEIIDTNKFDIITATLQFGGTTTASLKTCNCTELKEDDGLITLKLPSTYTDTSDELLIELSDGKLSHLY